MAKLDLTVYPTYQTPVTEIFVREDRHRRTFPPKKMDELRASMKQLGQLQPGICTINEEKKLELVAGERRLRTCRELNLDFSYVLMKDLDPFTLELIQLEENIKRENLDWRDEVAAKERIHKLFQDKFGEGVSGSGSGHSLADTADYLGDSKTLTHEDIELATWTKHVPEVASAPNKTTAKKIVERLKQTVDRDIALEKAIESGHKSSALAEDSTIEASLEVETQDAFERQLLEYDRRCLLGKMEVRLKDFSDSSIDIMFFDPPWGVGIDTNKKSGGGTQSYSDDVEDFVNNLESWLSLLYTKMKPNSHLYMFFGIVHHDLVYSTLEEVGFETSRIPIIWYKKGAHSTRNPLLEPGRSYEPIAFARKGRKNLQLQGQPDHIITPMPSPRIKGIHPSAKHPEVYRNLINRSATPGDTILDPMAGSGMLGVAADSLIETLHLDWWMIEMDKDYKNLQLSNLVSGYWEITGDKNLGVAKTSIADEGEKLDGAFNGTHEPVALALDYKELTPGTDLWSRYWNLNPHKQDEMLEWKKSQE